MLPERNAPSPPLDPATGTANDSERRLFAELIVELMRELMGLEDAADDDEPVHSSEVGVEA